MFSNFQAISLSELSDIILNMKSTTCSCDVVPTKLLKDVLPSVLPSLLSIINGSVQTGIVPSCLKKAVVQPLLKITNLDPTELNNYRPISKLPFLHKVLEKVVLNQISLYLNSNDILDPFQSGFRTKYRTESALLRVVNYILLSADCGNCTILLLLDLSAAFDTVDHCILLKRFNLEVGICGTALDWFASYLTNRSFSVEIGEFSSSSVSITCGVPQGSILGPILFSLYLLPLRFIFESHKVSYHIYADDTQVYFPLKSGSDSVSSLLACLEDIKNWMENNFLQLNQNKTEVILFGPSHLLQILKTTSVKRLKIWELFLILN